MADRNVDLRNNLMSFKEAFKEYTDCYTVIGGAACFIIMDAKTKRFFDRFQNNSGAYK